MRNVWHGKKGIQGASKVGTWRTRNLLDEAMKSRERERERETEAENKSKRKKKAEREQRRRGKDQKCGRWTCL